MINNLQELLANRKYKDESTYMPFIFRVTQNDDKGKITRLLTGNNAIKIFDTLADQLKELIRIKNPSKRLSPEIVDQMVKEHLNGIPMEEYGVWVYYPWSEKLVHLLDEEEFIEVRTNRNLYKITREERDILSQKKIGVIGLSVGQSIAVTLAMERVGGELRLADFDSLELSNFNRIRTPLSNLSVSKTIAAAREITEIDPYLKITCYNEGITENNLEEFLTANGKLDLLIEECDGLDIKILARTFAKKHLIPVLMDTSDKGLIDIERFDLEPERAILHGMLEGIDISKLRDLTLEQKIPLVLKLAGGLNISNRAKVSLIELNETILTWPQLASSVVMGGGISTDLSRRILLNHLNLSGRFNIDLEELIMENKKNEPDRFKCPDVIDLKKQINLIKDLAIKDPLENKIFPSAEFIQSIVKDASKAPSTGNDQPWMWAYSKSEGKLHLFHNKNKSFSFGDYQNIASYISLGATLENLVLASQHNHTEIKTDLFPIKENDDLVLSISFYNKESDFTEKHIYPDLYNYIDERTTNRNISPRINLMNSEFEKLKQVVEYGTDAKVIFIENEKELTNLGEIISACDRIRIMNPHGHYDFFNREMRWSNEEARNKKDGMYIGDLSIPPSAMLALQMIKNDEVISILRNINGGQAFKKVSVLNTQTASAMGLIIMPKFNPMNFLNGGRIMQRMWLEATKLNLSIHPLIAPLYLFPRIIHGNGEGLSKNDIKELSELRIRFEKIFATEKMEGEIFLFKVFKTSAKSAKSFRKDVNEILSIIE
jgi:ThiF family